MATMFFVIRIVLCLFAHFSLGSFVHQCPGPIYPPQGFSYARIESNISGRASQEYAKIRIKVIYHPSIDDKPYRGLVQDAVDFWSNALSVKPVDGRLFKARDCESGNKTINNVKYCLGSCEDVTKCHDVEVQKEHLDGCKHCTLEGKYCTKDQTEPGTGIKNADLVFYASAIASTRCLTSQPLAYAGPCELEPVLDRPVFAVINICPQEAEEYRYDKKTMLRTMKHEMLHALGFGSLMFMHFRDKEGQPLWERNKNGQPILNDTKYVNQTVLKGIFRKWPGEPITTERAFLVTPSVKREAQAHFGCDDLEGAELEDFPRPGSQFGHFEARVFYDDSMKSNADTGKGLFSRVDFAVLEDSGWYQVNYSQAEDMDFGRNLGCEFCMKSCKSWIFSNRIVGRPPGPYCDTPDLGFFRGLTCIGPKLLFTGCPLAKLGPGFIQKLHHPNSFEPRYQLPRKYQHFNQIYGVSYLEIPQWGSLDAFADCCPVPVQNYDVTGQVGNLKCGMDPNLPRNPYPLNPNNPPNPNPGWNPNPPFIPKPPFIPNPPFIPRPTWKPIPTWKQLESNPTKTPQPTRRPWETTPPSAPIPVEAAEDDEEDAIDEIDGSSSLGSSVLFIFLFPLSVMML